MPQPDSNERANHPGLDEPLRLKRRTGVIPRSSLTRARTVVGVRIRTAHLRAAERAEKGWTSAEHLARLDPSHDDVDGARNNVSVPPSIPPMRWEPGGPERVQRDRTSTRKPIKGASAGCDGTYFQVERSSTNQKVAGSSPAERTLKTPAKQHKKSPPM